MKDFQVKKKKKLLLKIFSIACNCINTLVDWISRHRLTSQPRTGICYPTWGKRKQREKPQTVASKRRPVLALRSCDLQRALREPCVITPHSPPSVARAGVGPYAKADALPWRQRRRRGGRCRRGRRRSVPSADLAAAACNAQQHLPPRAAVPSGE